MTGPQIMTRLARFGACDIADALTKLKHPAGGFLSGLKLRGPTQDTKVVGRAHTVLFRANSVAPQKKGFQGHYIDSVTPGSVLFMSAPANLPNAVYGGLMSMRAKTLGAVGTVVDGRLRDLAEHRNMGYPVFSRDVGITAGQEVCYSSEINVPVPLRSAHQPDVWIHPGDIIVGDENGLACIPQELEEKVLEILPVLAERDRLSMQDLESGMKAADVFRNRRGT
ncbi:uncharacterized protein I303_105645 [Kwoniella dejecticola CBS 10117]|uniref:4-hydroxy-4-methyl-2-oxoglutarate aldolase n=1 Tax=Kwoniella dejecticola CBS 10117 TaxID=1296121 RepID=A0A1A6A003_9TREE|nr:uncharacterized protein I303_05667 [Kwoniella dejecticola CBS 10117]OBR83389.1 hypothetical protein I303_05667 [Kwoniella dejecticola CBS 10117]